MTRHEPYNERATPRRIIYDMSHVLVLSSMRSQFQAAPLLPCVKCMAALHISFARPAPISAASSASSLLQGNDFSL
ncbi:hypothetical protein FKM82_013544 [Ascaphus truei]